MADCGMCGTCWTPLLSFLEVRASFRSGISVQLVEVLSCGCGARETCADAKEVGTIPVT